MNREVSIFLEYFDAVIEVILLGALTCCDWLYSGARNGANYTIDSALLGGLFWIDEGGFDLAPLSWLPWMKLYPRALSDELLRFKFLPGDYYPCFWLPTGRGGLGAIAVKEDWSPEPPSIPSDC